MYEHLKSQTLPELTATLKELGLPAFRGKQVYTWLHKGVRSYDEMTNLSKDLHLKLAVQRLVVNRHTVGVGKQPCRVGVSVDCVGGAVR